MKKGEGSSCTPLKDNKKFRHKNAIKYKNRNKTSLGGVLGVVKKSGGLGLDFL